MRTINEMAQELDMGHPYEVYLYVYESYQNGQKKQAAELLAETADTYEGGATATMNYWKEMELDVDTCTSIVHLCSKRHEGVVSESSIIAAWGTDSEYYTSLEDKREASGDVIVNAVAICDKCLSEMAEYISEYRCDNCGHVREL